MKKKKRHILAMLLIIFSSFLFCASTPEHENELIRNIKHLNYEMQELINYINSSK